MIVCGGFRVGAPGARLVALLLTAVGITGGCSHDDTPPPIPDPGGPFQTGVAANKPLGSLTNDEVQELCAEISNAQATFLTGAVLVEENCRSFSFEFIDAGAGFLAECQTTYDMCKKDSHNSGPLNCPLPAPGCNAPVELVSACLNEMAATNPLSTCVTQPTCETAAANPATTVDAGTPDLSNLPPMPACERLAKECDTLFFSYPCH